MKEENKILSKQYIVENGKNFDESLWFTSYGAEVLDNPEDEGGKPFTGIAYEIYENGNLAYYGYYKEGFMEGEYVEFYTNGQLKSIEYMIKGQTRGIRKMWHDTGERKYEGEHKFGICLYCTEWDKKGEIIRQKFSPTDSELKRLGRFSDHELRG
ncbi:MULTISPECIES: toxin-antitoxin system YwqK family antitoxin [Priestia]|uniref:toxin-antitoxin system YwqK family antitoxin n=1 Tax=Priestia TaxID=2800373 RepID=UPI0002FFC0F3|nr:MULTISPECIES: hypothetical protein [Priestia]ANF46522.1 hypothetical protein AZK53_12800 [Priestia megaterium]AQU74231.1 hypothetical protein BUW91_13410 [Priestia megaterium]AYE50882.1 hypothetical protein OEA_14310 [Priestia megaterium NCT-2]MBE5099378.1 hypothetical protein [Priestia aryabhattai]MCU7763798.1 hypothetical protein [Priestia megaterium]